MNTDWLSTPPERANAHLGEEPVLRIGVPHRGGALCLTAYREGMPVMVSASAFWDRQTRRFRTDADIGVLQDCDFALDSAGFTAMMNWKRLGRQPGMLGVFPWSLVDYVNLIGVLRPAWASQPDMCVEPEIAHDAGVRHHRIEATAAMLEAHLALVARWQDLGAFWLAPPVPVLQGWFPDDYVRSLDLMQEAWEKHTAHFDAPVLIGLGSMCRRPLNHAQTGIRAILDHLLPRLPRTARIHCFGVKGAAMKELADMPQVASFDSMAWDFGARVAARKADAPRSMEHRAAAMRDWYDQQRPRRRRTTLAAEVG